MRAAAEQSFCCWRSQYCIFGRPGCVPAWLRGALISRTLALSPAAKYDTVICIKLNGYDSRRGARAQDDNEMTRKIATQTPTAWLTTTQISPLIARETSQTTILKARALKKENNSLREQNFEYEYKII
jgi:hypothetical protein